MTTTPFYALRFVVLSVALTACGPNLAALHRGAEAGRLQADAPLHARQSVTIAAPRAQVYALLTGFSQWPQWQPNIISVTGPRSVTPGEHFTWKNGSAEISSQLAAVTADELLAWTGSVSTAKAVHIWRLSSPTPDTTLVDVEETMDGFLLTLFYGQADLEADMERSLVNLRMAAEGRARVTK